MRKEGYQVPEVQFAFRENGEFVIRTSSELFDKKRVVIFSLPGAFTPTCSAYQLPGFEEKYEELLPIVKKNFDIASKYVTVEDYIYEKYLLNTL